MKRSHSGLQKLTTQRLATSVIPCPLLPFYSRSLVNHFFSWSFFSLILLSALGMPPRQSQAAVLDWIWPTESIRKNIAHIREAVDPMLDRIEGTLNSTILNIRQNIQDTLVQLEVSTSTIADHTLEQLDRTQRSVFEQLAQSLDQLDDITGKDIQRLAEIEKSIGETLLTVSRSNALPWVVARSPQYFDPKLGLPLTITLTGNHLQSNESRLLIGDCVGAAAPVDESLPCAIPVASVEADTASFVVERAALRPDQNGLVTVAVELIAPQRPHRFADRFTKLVDGDRREMVRYPLLLRALPSDLGTLTVESTYRNMEQRRRCRVYLDFQHICWRGDTPCDEKVQRTWRFGGSPSCNGASDSDWDIETTTVQLEEWDLDFGNIVRVNEPGKPLDDRRIVASTLAELKNDKKIYFRLDDTLRSSRRLVITGELNHSAGPTKSVPYLKARYRLTYWVKPSPNPLNFVAIVPIKGQPGASVTLPTGHQGFVATVRFADGGMPPPFTKAGTHGWLKLDYSPNSRLVTAAPLREIYSAN